jgi:hypothetical protein
MGEGGLRAALFMKKPLDEAPPSWCLARGAASSAREAGGEQIDQRIVELAAARGREALTSDGGPAQRRPSSLPAGCPF